MENFPNFPKKQHVFACEKCHITTRNKKDYANHVLTAKHLKQAEGYGKISNISPISPDLFKCICGNIYKHNSGLWRHKKNCNVSVPVPVPSTVPATVPVPVTVSEEQIATHPSKENKDQLIAHLTKENDDFKHIILEMQKQFMESCKNNSITNNINHTNSHNKTFNLQIFLNEQCKDAMNMSEFVESFELQLSDLESVGKLGYVDGITKIFVDRLNSMDIHKRPMHCSDAKREILYIKDENRWEREKPNNPKLRKAVRTVSFKNMKLANLWSETYPESKSSESNLNDLYMKLVIQSTGGSGEISASEDKIIRYLTKGVVIDKNML
jgi:hypothetical protein